MKAKEYADRFNANPTAAEVVDIGFEFWKEIEKFMYIRHAQHDSALLAILNELDAKWLAFSRLTNDVVNPKGFQIIIKELMPEVYKVWKPGGVL